MEGTTKTRARPVKGADQAAVWKLYPVYSGSAGIIDAKPQCWDGKNTLTIGRRTAASRGGAWLLLDDDMVSREHARLLLAGPCRVVKDLGSKNGTIVNSHRLLPSEEWELEDGDVIEIGDSLIVARHEPTFTADATIASLVGRSASMCTLRSAVAEVAPRSHAVLLVGETGTGKGAATDAIHRLSGRHGRLVSVNCAATPSTLAESSFFGVRRGAYTGAVEQNGFFREADQGTLFLDEIGDLPTELQPKLLHALEAGEVVPVGSARPVKCSPRIVAATNRDLDSALGETFRSDLYARLACSVIRLPPVRQRREDVLLLARHIGGAAFHPSPRLAAIAVRHSWPFNVREIGNFVQQVASHGEDKVCRQLEAVEDSADDAATSQRPQPSKRKLVEMLAQARGNLKELERSVGYSRRQVLRWVAEYQIDLEKIRNKHSKA